MKKISLFFKTNNRLYTHLLFWLVYYIYRVFSYIDEYDYTIYVQFIELPVKIALVYLNLYVLMPLLLRKQNFFVYGLSIISLIVLGGILQSEIIRIMMKLNIYAFKPHFQTITFFPFKVVHLNSADLLSPSLYLYSPRKYLSTISHLNEIILLTSIIKILKDFYLSQQRQQVFENEKLETELKFLKTQINPHFFFNTLNNLYSLVLLKSDKAPNVVLKLSELMSYMLYETNQSEVSLEKEVNYLQNYIELEKLRFGDELDLSFKIEGNINAYKIAPMLLLSLVENSFKHPQVNEENKIVIQLDLQINARGELNFKLSNSFSHAKWTNAEEEPQGIGLKNLQRRLELLYLNQFVFETQIAGNFYQVRLKLNLHQ